MKPMAPELSLPLREPVPWTATTGAVLPDISWFGGINDAHVEMADERILRSIDRDVAKGWHKNPRVLAAILVAYDSRLRHDQLQDKAHSSSLGAGSAVWLHQVVVTRYNTGGNASTVMRTHKDGIEALNDYFQKSQDEVANLDYELCHAYVREDRAPT